MEVPAKSVLERDTTLVIGTFQPGPVDVGISPRYSYGSVTIPVPESARDLVAGFVANLVEACGSKGDGYCPVEVMNVRFPDEMLCISLDQTQPDGRTFNFFLKFQFLDLREANKVKSVPVEVANVQPQG